MNAFQKLLGGAALALAVAAGLAMPAMAQKLDNKKNPPVATVSSAGIDFGDDSSDWSNDGECDDPRFAGDGMADELVGDDVARDATDCRTLFESGAITLAEPDFDHGTTVGAEIDFGDDSSEWANDGECDDPRFTGPGAAAELVDDDMYGDATDCRTAYEAGTVTLKDGGTATPAATSADPADIDFGDDSSEWANDGECDDPRFAGPGAAAELVDDDMYGDATDCRAAYEAGTVTLADNGGPGEIDFGDDSSEWANDGECDDPRFSGSGVAGELLDSDIGRDATDCRAAVEAGTATYNGGSATAAAAEFDYGGDWSRWANDGECDDLRFTGPGTDKKLLTDDMYGDATDCRTLEAEGQVSIRTVYTPEYAAGAPYDSSHIDFGDNMSSYANDDVCDDPRFEGPGAASVLLDSDEFHDADDCQAAYESGTIMMIGQEGAQG